MKFAKIALTLASLCASTAVFAGTISGASNVGFLAFDGQKLKKNATLTVNDTNQHQVVVDVSTIYRSGSDEIFFESDPIVLTFAGSQEDIKITPPELRSGLDVEKFQRKPSFKIQTASGKNIEYKVDYLKGEGFMPNLRIEENLANYNSGEGVAAVKSFVTTPIAAMMPSHNGKAAKGKIMVQGENIAEQQLQYWFQQADKETQKRFLDWAKKQ